MNWSNSWPKNSGTQDEYLAGIQQRWPTTQSPNPPAINTSWSTQANPWDALSQDELLVKHIALKEAVDKAKEAEMELRKYIVNRAFPEKKEGMNTLELGEGYQLKATVKFNYNLADNDTVEKTLDKIAKIGNDGAFIAERLVGWTPSFHLTEYRNLVEAAPSSAVAQEILAAIGEMLIITDAAPELKIKEPKVKK